MENCCDARELPVRLMLIKCSADAAPGWVDARSSPERRVRSSSKAADLFNSSPLCVIFAFSSLFAGRTSILNDDIVVTDATVRLFRPSAIIRLLFRPPPSKAVHDEYLIRFQFLQSLYFPFKFRFFKVLSV